MADFGMEDRCYGHGPELVVGEDSWERWRRRLALFGLCKKPS